MFNDEWVGKYKISEKRYKYEKKELLSLGYTAFQANKVILRVSSEKTIAKIIELHYQLISVFNRDQIIRIAGHNGGGKSLEAVWHNYKKINNLGFTLVQIVSMASHKGGSKTINTVLKLYPKLIKLNLTIEQIANMASHQGSAKTLNLLLEFTEPLLFNKNQPYH